MKRLSEIADAMWPSALMATFAVGGYFMSPTPQPVAIFFLAISSAMLAITGLRQLARRQP